MNTYIQFAPVLRREMIRAVAIAFKEKKVSFPEAEKVVLMLASKNAALQRSGRADEAYGNLMRKAGVIGRPRHETPLHQAMQEHIDRRDKREKKRIRQLEKEIRAIEEDTKSERLVTVILYTLPEKKTVRKARRRSNSMKKTWCGSEGT